MAVSGDSAPLHWVLATGSSAQRGLEAAGERAEDPLQGRTLREDLGGGARGRHNREGASCTKYTSLPRTWPQEHVALHITKRISAQLTPSCAAAGVHGAITRLLVRRTPGPRVAGLAKTAPRVVSSLPSLILMVRRCPPPTRSAAPSIADQRSLSTTCGPLASDVVGYSYQAYKSQSSHAPPPAKTSLARAWEKSSSRIPAVYRVGASRVAVAPTHTSLWTYRPLDFSGLERQQQQQEYPRGLLRHPPCETRRVAGRWGTFF